MANEIGITRLGEEKSKGKWKVITRTLYETEKGSVDGEIKNV